MKQSAAAADADIVVKTQPVSPTSQRPSTAPPTSPSAQDNAMAPWQDMKPRRSAMVSQSVNGPLPSRERSESDMIVRAKPQVVQRQRPLQYPPPPLG